MSVDRDRRSAQTRIVVDEIEHDYRGEEFYAVGILGRIGGQRLSRSRC